MKTLIKALSLSAFAVALSFSQASFASEFGTKAEAEALVKKTVQSLKSDGADKTYAAITAKDAKFIDRDLYPVIYSMEGDCLAHGANAKLVGKNLADVQDADGKSFVKERMEKAAVSEHFWQDYKYVNPVSKKIEPKEAFCQKVEKVIVCAGAYKQ